MDIRQKILIIENDQTFVNTLIKLLASQDFDIETAYDGEQALMFLRDRNFDLIITDILLPGELDGIDIIEKVKETSSRGAKTIIITGCNDEAMPIRAIRAGVDDYIQKPLQEDCLLHSVQRSLRLRRMEKEGKAYVAKMEELQEKSEQYQFLLEEKIRDKTARLALLLAIGKELISSLHLDEVLAMIVQRTADTLSIERCSLLLLDKKRRYLRVAASRGIPEKIVASARVKTGEKISGWVLLQKEPILVKDIETDHRFAKRNAERYYTNSFISAPLIFNNEAIGVLNVNNKQTREAFTKEDLQFVEGIADQASVAIANARLYSHLKGVYLEIIAALTAMIEMKDHYTKGHSERVTRYAGEMAKAMKLPESLRETIQLACQLHDLGKIGVHEHILTKSGKLNNKEWKEIKSHPTRAVEILQPLTFLKDVMKLVEQHHERWDGKGYPKGLKGERIELGARIMAVADSFDAMTTKRPYARAFPTARALSELKQCSGTQFDPRVVDTFVKIIKMKPHLGKK